MSKVIYITITALPEFRKLMDRYVKKQMMKRSEFIRAAVLHYIDFLNRDEPKVDD